MASNLPLMEVEIIYRRADYGLPDALPTPNAIAAAPTIQDHGFGKRIAIVEGKFIVKHGPRVTENEGNTLLFIEKELDIPAPRLCAMYRVNGELYLIMSKMEGVALQTLWPGLSNAQKESVIDQLKEILKRMRSLPSPGFYGNVDKGPLHHRFFLTLKPQPDINGPFSGEKDFNSAMTKQSLLGSQQSNSRSCYIHQHLPETLHGHPSVFTHSDLHRNNILIMLRDDRITVSGIVDWETSGWYPDYWEYAVSFVEFEWIDDWPQKFASVIQPYLLEAAMLNMISQNIDY